MQAVELSSSGMVMFSTVELPESLRREIVDGGQGQIHDEVRLVRHKGSDENRSSETVLCVSRTDPIHYELMNACCVDPSRFRVVDRAFRVISDIDAWHNFFHLRKQIQAIAENATGVELPDDAEDID